MQLCPVPWAFSPGSPCWLVPLLHGPRKVSEWASLIGWNIVSEGGNQLVASKLCGPGKDLFSCSLGLSKLGSHQVGEQQMGIQVLRSVLVPELQQAFFLMGKTECTFPSMHQTWENFLRKHRAPWSFCDLVTPQGRSPVAGLWQMGWTKANEVLDTWILKRN